MLCSGEVAGRSSGFSWCFLGFGAGGSCNSAGGNGCGGSLQLAVDYVAYEAKVWAKSTKSAASADLMDAALFHEPALDKAGAGSKAIGLASAAS